MNISNEGDTMKCAANCLLKSYCDSPCEDYIKPNPPEEEEVILEGEPQPEPEVKDNPPEQNGESEVPKPDEEPLENPKPEPEPEPEEEPKENPPTEPKPEEEVKEPEEPVAEPDAGQNTDPAPEAEAVKESEPKENPPALKKGDKVKIDVGEGEWDGMTGTIIKTPVDQTVDVKVPNHGTQTFLQDELVKINPPKKKGRKKKAKAKRNPPKFGKPPGTEVNIPDGGDGENPYRGFSNANKLYVGKVKKEPFIMGEFGSFYSGHLYFGKVWQLPTAPNGFSVSSKGAVDIIVDKDDGEVKLTAIAPMGRTVVGKSTVAFSSWKQILDSAFALANARSIQSKKTAKGDVSSTLTGLVDITDSFSVPRMKSNPPHTETPSTDPAQTLCPVCNSNLTDLGQSVTRSNPPKLHEHTYKCSECDKLYVERESAETVERPKENPPKKKGRKRKAKVKGNPAGAIAAVVQIVLPILTKFYGKKLDKWNALSEKEREKVLKGMSQDKSTMLKGGLASGTALYVALKSGTVRKQIAKMDFQDMKELLDAAKVPQSGTTPMPAIKANPGETPENKQEQEEGEEDSNANINHEPEKVIE
jgi:hypothetical protein